LLAKYTAGRLLLLSLRNLLVSKVTRLDIEAERAPGLLLVEALRRATNEPADEPAVSFIDFRHFGIRRSHD
jgi:hypothetical protein